MGKEKPKQRKSTNGAAVVKDVAPEQNHEQRSSGIWQDERFQHLVTDPRFKNLNKAQRKVKIDKRFESMFTDKKFNVKYTVDKYGRRINRSTADDLRKYYELNSSDSEAEDDKDGKKEAAEKRKEEKAISRQSGDESSAESVDAKPTEATEDNASLQSDDDEDVPKTLRERLLNPDIDYARGEGRLVTDSSSGDESTDDDSDPELQLDHVWGQLDNDAETTEDSTKRLAVCNMDWDRIRATDLMVLFSSFLPPGGSVLAVKIYTSEFGKERLEEEERNGPPELVEQSKFTEKATSNEKAQNDDDSESDEELVQEQDSDAEEGDDYHMEKLRQYQLNRLRYYYAVVECDSVRTADKIYQECDGNEYESSATRIDLRFIPDDTTFDEDEPHDVCNELPDSNSYKPRQFTTTALQQSNVDLTWDETAVERRELGDKLLLGKLEDVSDADIRKLVAYSSEEDDDEDDVAEAEEVEVTAASEKNHENIEPQEENAKPIAGKKSKKKKEDSIAKYKALLVEINEQEEKERRHKYGMQISWNVEPKQDAKEDNDDDDDNEDELDADSAKPKPQMTPIEKALLKKSEKNKQRKDGRKKKKREALGLDTDDSGSDSETMPDGIDMNDPYFAEEFAKGDFIEPKSKKQQKMKKKKHIYEEENDEDKQKEQELQLLLDDDDEQGKQHFSLNKILSDENETKSKRKRKKQLKKSKSVIAEERKELEDNFQVNLSDNRFGAVYNSHLFNIDPSDSHFKKTKGMEQIIHEKLKRRHGGEGGNNEVAPVVEDNMESKRPKKQLENKMLVKSLKRKIQMKQQH